MSPILERQNIQGRYFLSQLFKGDEEKESWFESHPIPPIVDAAYLSITPPEIHKIIRESTLVSLLQGLRPTRPQETMLDMYRHMGNAFHPEVPMGLRVWNDFYENKIDAGRVKERILPIDTLQGSVLIVVDSVSGVGWRIGKDHKLAKKYPKLTKTRRYDETQYPGTFKNSRQLYIPVAALEATTDADTLDQVAQQIAIFTQMLIQDSSTELKVTEHSHMQGSMETLSTAVELYRGEPSPAGLVFFLGHDFGTKTVVPFGNQAMDGEFDEVSDLGQHLFRTVSVL